MRLISFGEANVFDEVSRQTLAPIFIKKEPALLSSKIKIDEGLSLVDPDRTVSFHEVPQSLFLELPGYQIRHEVTIEQFDLLQKIDRESIRLGNICYVNYGAQVSSKKSGEYSKSDVVSNNSEGNAKRFFEGKDIGHYLIQWSGLYLDYRPDTMYGPRAEELFDSPKIVFRKISGPNDTLLVAFDYDGFYCDDGLVLAVPYDAIVGSKLRGEFEGYEKLEEVSSKSLKNFEIWLEKWQEAFADNLGLIRR